jgi:hypothetical protein
MCFVILVATQCLGCQSAFAAGMDKEQLIISYAIWVVIFFGALIVGYVCGVGLKLNQTMYLFIILNCILFLTALLIGGLSKFIERLNVVISIVVFLNLPIGVGWLIGRHTFHGLKGTFGKEPTTHG